MHFDPSLLEPSPSLSLKGFTRNRLFDLLVYESYDPKLALFFNRGSTGFVLKGHPLVGANLDDQDRLADFLKEEAHLPEGSSLQVLLNASPLIGPLLNYWKSYRHASPFEELAQRRVDFLSSYAYSNMEGQVLRDFRVYISYSLPLSHLTHLHENQLLETRRALKEALLSMGFMTSEMDGHELVQMMRDLLHPTQRIFPEAVSFNLHDSLRRQMNRPDYSLEVDEEGLLIRDADQTGWLWRGFIPVKWPHLWALGYMDRFCGDLLNTPHNLPTPFWIHYGLSVVSHQTREKALNTTRRESLESSLKSRLSKWIPGLEEEYHETCEIVGELQKGERVILSGLCVGILSHPSEKVRVEQAYRSLWTKLGFECRATRFDHLPMLLSCLPMTWTQEGKRHFSLSSQNEGFGPSLYRMGLAKKTLTREAQNLLPLVGEWKGQASPGMLLYGRRGQLFFWNPFGVALLPHAKDAQTDHNYNVCIAGQSGSGKSVFMNEMMTTILGIGGRVFVLDFGRSFKKTCLLLGGQHIECDLASPLSLNPFTHIPETEDAQAGEMRESMLSTLRAIFQVMAAPTHGTTDLQNAFLEQAIRATWEQFKSRSTVTDVCTWLLGHGDEVARHLGQMLFSFSRSGNYGRFFEGEATANLTASLVVIETDHLRNHPDLMAVLVQMMILQINQTMANGDRTTPFLILIDEAWKLLQGKDSAAFISQATRTARKYKGSIVLGTQHLTDYFKAESPAATEAFNCSAWKCVLYQESDVIEALTFHPQLRHFVENDWHKRILKSIHSKPPHYSEVCLFGPHLNGIIGRLKLDPFSRLLYSTNPEEYQRVENHLKRGLPIQQAIEAVLREEAT